MCKMFGHDYSKDQVCRFAAQFYWTNKFIESEENLQCFTENAKKYKEMQGQRHNKMVNLMSAAKNIKLQNEEEYNEFQESLFFQGEKKNEDE